MKRAHLVLAGWGVAAILIALVMVQPVAAQNNQNFPGFHLEGTIKGLVPGYLQIVGSARIREGEKEGEAGPEEEWVVQVPATARGMRFVGSAEPNWLMAGMWVNFTTRFNKKGQALDAIKLLHVFTPGTSRGEGETQYQPGIKPLTNLGEGISFSGEEKVKPMDDAALYEVTGMISNLGKQGLSVSVGDAIIQIPLAEGASISVDLADLRPTRVGDKIKVNGRAVAPGKGIASWGQVTGAEPLSNAKPAAEGKSKVPEKKTAGETTPAVGGKKLPPLGEKLPPLGEKPAPEKPAGEKPAPEKPAE